MEILNKNNLKYLILLFVLILVGGSFYAYKNYSDLKKTKSYFDLYLANTYNELDETKIISNTRFLSNIEIADISFFANLKLASLNQIENYDNFQKDLILLKHSIVNEDLIKLKDIQSGVLFNQTASIYYLNTNLDSILKTEFDNLADNFFTKAVSLYLDDN
ncbi:hypothetical protein N9T31_00235 [Alphaproteobacteria bacterium]|nr:hypothetical protein [Alphaproteobacteria bacterium]